MSEKVLNKFYFYATTLLTYSGQLDIKDEIVLTVKNFDELKGKTLKLVWKDGSSKEIPIDSEELKIRDIFIGTACMFIK